jgi:hypothetical protein
MNANAEKGRVPFDSRMAAEPLRDRTPGKDFWETGNQVREHCLIEMPEAVQRKSEAVPRVPFWMTLELGFSSGVFRHRVIKMLKCSS